MRVRLENADELATMLLHELHVSNSALMHAGKSLRGEGVDNTSRPICRLCCLSYSTAPPDIHAQQLLLGPIAHS